MNGSQAWFRYSDHDTWTGLWRSPHCWIRLDVQLTSTWRELEHVQWAACVPKTNRATWVELGHWTQERLVTLTCHIAACVQVDCTSGQVDWTTARFLATNGFVWYLTVPLWKHHKHEIFTSVTLNCNVLCLYIVAIRCSTITLVHSEHCQDCAIYLLWPDHCHRQVVDTAYSLFRTLSSIQSRIHFRYGQEPAKSSVTLCACVCACVHALVCKIICSHIV